MKKLSYFVFGCAVLLSVMATTVLASSVLLSYEGWGIRGKASVRSFSLNSNISITINHTNSNFSYNGPDEDIMIVTLQKKNWFGDGTLPIIG